MKFERIEKPYGKNVRKVLVGKPEAYVNQTFHCLESIYYRLTHKGQFKGHESGRSLGMEVIHQGLSRPW